MRSVGNITSRFARPGLSVVVVVVCVIVVVAVVAASRGGDGPGSYVGAASNAVVYVSWTRSHDSLSGQLTQARASDDASVGEVHTDRVSFGGSVDGSAVSLRLNEGLGSESTLTGKLDGDTLTLEYPAADGGVLPIKLHKGDGTAFNDKLSALRTRATDAKNQADEAAAEQEARDDAAQFADGVRASIAALGRAADNATSSAPGAYASDLDTIRSALDTARTSYELVTQDVANGYTVCDDAASVGDDVDGLKGDIASMRADVKRSSDPGVLADDIRDLRTVFAQLQSFDQSSLPANAPTEDDVAAAIRAARRKVRVQGGRGADFAKVQALLAQAEALKAKADAACRAHGE